MKSIAGIMKTFFNNHDLLLLMDRFESKNLLRLSLFQSQPQKKPPKTTLGSKPSLETSSKPNKESCLQTPQSFQNTENKTKTSPGPPSSCCSLFCPLLLQKDQPARLTFKGSEAISGDERRSEQSLKRRCPLWRQFCDQRKAPFWRRHSTVASPS